MKVRNKVLFITDQDFKSIKPFEALRYTISGFPPLHKYQGMLTLTDKALIINELSTDPDLIISVPKREINQLFMGFDSIYRYYYARGLGFRWQPVRLQVENREFMYLYLIFGEKFWGDANKIWYENIKYWLNP